MDDNKEAPIECWAIRYKLHGVQRIAYSGHNSVADYRDIDPEATSVHLTEHARHGRFAGWFSEQKSGMSYRLWEQGGHEQQPGEVALYE